MRVSDAWVWDEAHGGAVQLALSGSGQAHSRHCTALPIWLVSW